MIGIIPAAGKGLRFKELGKQYSKTILPYNEKPILIHQIEWFESQNCTDIRVVVNHQLDKIKNILKFYNKNVSIHVQEIPNGLTGAINTALSSDDKGAVLIALGDLLINEDIEPAQFNTNFISIKKVNDFSRWCMIDTEKKKLIDKPKVDPNTKYAVSGVYYLKNVEDVYRYSNEQLLSNTKIENEYQFSYVLNKFIDDEFQYIELSITDFGTLDEYLENRGVRRTRWFNDLSIQKHTVKKESATKGNKIIDEYNWYNNIPLDIKIHTPNIISYDFHNTTPHYVMSRVYSPTLREIYLFLDNNLENWDNIFNKCFSLLNEMKSFGITNDFISFIPQKTQARVDKITIDVDHALINNFMETLKTFCANEKYECNSVMHGDFCFSNLFFNAQEDNIIMIDPRGEVFGNHYYDVAKLAHSVLYDYDVIDAELYIYNKNKILLYNEGKSDIKQLFMTKLKNLYTESELKFIGVLTASLFLSMIPLHSHNETNQNIFYLKFVEIYKGLDL